MMTATYTRNQWNAILNHLARHGYPSLAIGDVRQLGIDVADTLRRRNITAGPDTRRISVRIATGLVIPVGRIGYGVEQRGIV